MMTTDTSPLHLTPRVPRGALPQISFVFVASITRVTDLAEKELVAVLNLRERRTPIQFGKKKS